MAEHKGHGNMVEVVHDLVGPFRRGAHVWSHHFEDVQRLLDIGAVVPSDRDQEWDGRGDQTLPEALRGGQIGSLTNMPTVDVSPEEVRGRMGITPQEATIQTGQTTSPGTTTETPAPKHKGHPDK